MKKVFLKGYINYNNDDYTFIYEDKKLTLISTENVQTFFNEYKLVDYFEGFTLDGFDIIFYINNNVYNKDGCYICSPRCILLSQKKNYRISDMNFDTLRFSGDIINRFYSNRNMIEFVSEEKDYFKYRDIKETVYEEKVNLNGTDSIFELSIMKPGWKDDGIITFNNYDSLLRIKYNVGKENGAIIKDLNSIDKFFKFCANRINISFDNVFLEIKNKDKKYEKAVEIIIPYMIDNKINKDMLTYELLKDNLDKILKFLDGSNYIFSIIPDDNDAFASISNKDYCAAFSCFESIYQYIHNDNQKIKMIDDEKALEEVKEELLPLLNQCDEKYKGKNRLKRDFIKRFIDIISKANLRLEKCILNELEKNMYIVDGIYYERRDKIKTNSIKKSVTKAIADRDDITHNNTVKLDSISIGIYEIILRLNYAMILEYVGVSKEILEDKINYLGRVHII